MKETIYTRFVLSIVRHLVTYLSGTLVTWGVVQADLANEFTAAASSKITTGLISFLVILYFAWKDKVWEFVKTAAAKILPPNTTYETIVSVANNFENKTAIAKGTIDPRDSLQTLRTTSNEKPFDPNTLP